MDVTETQGGFTYLLVLIALTLLALSMSKNYDDEAIAHRQQQEAELLFRGEQIRHAMMQFKNAHYGNGCFPLEFRDLLIDERGWRPVYHLRQHYRDPLTGSALWGMTYDDRGRWTGVYSKGEGRPLRRDGFDQVNKGFKDADSYQQWVFRLDDDPRAPLPTACKSMRNRTGRERS